MARARACGAFGSFLSGAGPTILALIPAADKSFYHRGRQMLAEKELPYKLRMLRCDKAGATFTHIPD